MKNTLSEQYSYKIIDKSKDGTMAVKFIHNQSNYSFLFLIINGYLPPSNSV